MQIYFLFACIFQRVTYLKVFPSTFLQSVWHSSLTLLFVYYLTALPVAVAEQLKQFIIMKKTIFILAALLATTFANAQITLEKVLTDQVNFPQSNAGGSSHYDLVHGDIILSYTTHNNGENQIYYITIYDAYTYEEYISNAPFDDWNLLRFFSKGYLTNDNRVTYLVAIEDGENSHIYVRNLNHENIADLGDVNGHVYAQTIYKWSDGSARLILYTNDATNNYYYIYSLPGNGMATGISTPSSPKRSARKIAKGGQVLIETEANTYTMQGQEVK